MKKNEALLQLSVTPAMASSIIPVLEGEIAELSSKQTEANGLLKELSKPYLKQQKIVDEFNDVLKQKKAFLETILRRLGNVKGDVHRLMRASSHTNTKRVGDGIQWGREFTTILKTEGRLMNFEELKVAYVKRYPSTDMKAMKQKLYSQIYNMKRTSDVVIGHIKEGTTMPKKLIPLILYKDVWGLAEWFDLHDDGAVTPKPPYLKQFMYKTA